MEGTERPGPSVALRISFGGCSDSTRMEGTERGETSDGLWSWRACCSDSTRMEGTERAKSRRERVSLDLVAATRPAWRVLKDSCRYRGLLPGGMLQRLDPHGGY